MRINISLNKELLTEFEKVLRDREYLSRSKGIRDAIKDYIIRYKWKKEIDGEKIGIISVIYNPHSISVIENLTDIEHDFRKYINSVIHIYITENQCLGVIVVKGDIGYIKNLTGKLRNLKGIKHTKLTSSTIVND